MRTTSSALARATTLPMKWPKKSNTGKTIWTINGNLLLSLRQILCCVHKSALRMKRSDFFPDTRFCGGDDGRIFDACVGPALGTLQINDSMRSVIDYSAENERRFSRYWEEAANQEYWDETSGIPVWTNAVKGVHSW